MATIGEKINRVEGTDKVTGRARYRADFGFPELKETEQSGSGECSFR
jgi:hypothetical protein